MPPAEVPSYKAIPLSSADRLIVPSSFLGRLAGMIRAKLQELRLHLLVARLLQLLGVAHAALHQGHAQSKDTQVRGALGACVYA